MASNLGIDLGPTRLRAIEVDGSVKKPIIRRFATLDFERLGAGEEGGGVVQIESARIAEFLKTNKFVREPAVLGVDSTTCVFRELDLPFTGDEQIRKVIKFEAESHLQVALDEVVVSHKKLGKSRDKSHVLVVAARKEKIAEKLKLMNDAGVDPYFIDIELTALYNAIVALGYAEEHPSFAVVDCGPVSTSVLFLQDGELIAARSIRIGTHTLQEGSSGAGPQAPDSGDREDRGELLVLEDEAEEGQLATVPPAPAPAVAELATSGPFLKLSRELRRMLVTMRLKNPLDVIFTTGAGSTLPGFAEAISAEMEAPARPLDIASRVDSKVELGALEHEIAVPLGLAFKQMGHDAGRIDLRQEEYRYAKKFDQIKVPLACLSMVVLIFIALLDLYKFRVYRAHEQEKQDIAKLVKKEHGLYAAEEDGEAKPLPADLAGLKLVTRVKDELISRRDDLASRLGREGSIPGLPSALAAMGVFFKDIDQAKQKIGPLVLTKIDINLQSTEPSLQIAALVKSRQAYEDLRTALAADKEYFKAVGDATTDPTPDGWFRFQSLQVKLNKDALVVKS